MARLSDWSNAVLCVNDGAGFHSIWAMLTAQVVGGPELLVGVRKVELLGNYLDKLLCCLYPLLETVDGPFGGSGGTWRFILLQSCEPVCRGL